MNEKTPDFVILSIVVRKPHVTDHNTGRRDVFRSARSEKRVMPVILPRAGYWRRAIALTLDALIVGVVATFAVAIPVGLLFTLDNGSIQFGSTTLNPESAESASTGWRFDFGFPGIILTNCDKITLDHLPHGLEPPPPAKPTAAFECRSSAFGLFVSARTLTVVALTHENDRPISDTSSYQLGADGNPRSAWVLDNLNYVLLLVYLAAFQWRNGATLGMDALHIRVADSLAPDRTDLPLRRAVIRVAAQFAGVLVGFVFLVDSNSDFAAAGAPWLPGAVSIVVVAYYVWIFVDIIRKRDPIYDRIAGTAVVGAVGQ
jgi:uncharacterized RDD family membrane protein YckC